MNSSQWLRHPAEIQSPACGFKDWDGDPGLCCLPPRPGEKIRGGKQRQTRGRSGQSAKQSPEGPTHSAPVKEARTWRWATRCAVAARPSVGYSGRNLGLCFVSEVAACLRSHHGSLTRALSSPFWFQDEKSHEGNFHSLPDLPAHQVWGQSCKGPLCAQGGHSQTSTLPPEPQPSPCLSSSFCRAVCRLPFLPPQRRSFRDTVASTNSLHFSSLGKKKS